MSIRQFKHERRIQVAFSFRDEQCRELLPCGPITQSALTLRHFGTSQAPIASSADSRGEQP
ncbi:hypothetical protein [Methylibium sp.]|uniref:hypothetical protein n=1 Tax=Methylibium sp. TaxID=2067992 RepID=UPI00333F5F3E